MYDHLTGQVTECQPARVVLAVGGVGYELRVPLRVASRLRVGESARLFTILHVVDGTPTLLGFASSDEREVARRLLTVTGVGPSICLMILSTYGPEQVVRMILDGEADALRQVKGIGAKTAERLCLELRDHLAKLDLARSANAQSEAVLLPRTSADAIAALTMLGYSEKDARSRVAKAFERTPEADTEALIKAVLRSS